MKESSSMHGTEAKSDISLRNRARYGGIDSLRPSLKNPNDSHQRFLSTEYMVSLQCLADVLE